MRDTSARSAFAFRPKLVAATTGCLALALAGCGSTVETKPSATGTGFAAAGRVLQSTFIQSGGVVVGSKHLITTTNGGANWKSVPYPTQVAPTSVAAVTTRPDGGVWLAASVASGYQIWADPTGTDVWNSSSVQPSWPTSLPPLGAPTGVGLSTTPDGNIAAVLTNAVGSTTTATALLESTDGGFTYKQVSSRVDLQPWSTTFVSDTTVLAIEGPLHNFVSISTDGGTTWNKVTMSGATPQTQFATPVVNGSTVEIPSFTTGTSGEVVVVYTSSNSGTSFTAAPSTLTVPDTTGGGTIAFAGTGQTLWAVPSAQQEVYISADGGGTWQGVPASSLPAGVTSLSLASPTAAVASTTSSTCASFKRDCTTTDSVYTTNDGGKTWSQSS